MLLKKFLWFKYINIILLAVYGLFVTITIFHNGDSNQALAHGLIYTCIALLPIVIFPSVFFGIHYWYYRDKEVKNKLIITLLSAIFAVMFIASFWIDNATEYLSEKKIISFSFGMMFDASAVFYLIDVIKTNK